MLLSFLYNIAILVPLCRALFLSAPSKIFSQSVPVGWSRNETDPLRFLLLMITPERSSTTRIIDSGGASYGIEHFDGIVVSDTTLAQFQVYNNDEYYDLRSPVAISNKVGVMLILQARIQTDEDGLNNETKRSNCVSGNAGSADGGSVINSGTNITNIGGNIAGNGGTSSSGNVVCDNGGSDTDNGTTQGFNPTSSTLSNPPPSRPSSTAPDTVDSISSRSSVPPDTVHVHSTSGRSSPAPSDPVDTSSGLSSAPSKTVDSTSTTSSTSSDTVDPTSTTSSSTPSETVVASSSNDKTTILVGATVGSIAFLLLLGCVLLVFWHRSSYRSERRNPSISYPESLYSSQASLAPMRTRRSDNLTEQSEPWILSHSTMTQRQRQLQLRINELIARNSALETDLAAANERQNGSAELQTLQAEIEELRQLLRSDWALGLTDEPPPSYHDLRDGATNDGSLHTPRTVVV